MRHTPTLSWTSVGLAVLAGTAAANVKTAIGEQQPMRPLEVSIDTSAVPPGCRMFLAVPADSTSELYPWEQRLSLAACRAQITVAPVSSPQQLGGMIALIDRAMEPSRAIYRDALAHAPSSIRLAAGYGLGMSYLTTIVLARGALAVNPGLGGDTYGASVQDRARALRLALEPLLAADRDAARAAFDQVGQIALADPVAAAANDVTRYDVKDAATKAAQLR